MQRQPVTWSPTEHQGQGRACRYCNNASTRLLNERWLQVPTLRFKVWLRSTPNVCRRLPSKASSAGALHSSVSRAGALPPGRQGQVSASLAAGSSGMGEEAARLRSNCFVSSPRAARMAPPSCESAQKPGSGLTSGHGLSRSWAFPGSPHWSAG